MADVSSTGSDVDSKTSDVPETKGLHFVEPAHSVQVLTGLNSLRLARTLCDVTLCVDDQEFTCHKVALASFSPYFRAMFTGDLAESQQDRVSLKGVDASTIRQLVDYAYTSEIDFTETNVHSLLSAANLFDILPVRDACCTFLEKIMDGTNCLGISCFAEAHACYDLQKKAKAFILRNFSEVAAQEEFLQITSTKLTELLSDDLLEVDSEEDVFEAVMRWYGHDPDTRGANFEKVLEHVRLPLMSPNYLCDRVEMAPVVQQTPACRDLLEEAKTYHLLPDRLAELGSARTRSRTLKGQKEVIVIIGGWNRGHVQCVDGFSPRTRQWLSITDLPCALYSQGSVTSGCNKLYVAGGKGLRCKRTKGVFKYDPTLDWWLEVAPMIVPRVGLGLAVLGGYIYAVGGQDGTNLLNSVERYDVNNNSWQLIAPLKLAITCPAVVSVDGQLYVMGQNCNHQAVQKFDPRTGTWLVVAPMLNARWGQAACVLNGHIFVIGGRHTGHYINKVESYDPNKDEWRARESMKERRFQPGAAVADGRIYVFGGDYSEDKHKMDSNTIECYDPDKDSWEVVGEMPSGRSQFSCAVLRIPRDPDED